MIISQWFSDSEMEILPLYHKFVMETVKGHMKIVFHMHYHQQNHSLKGSWMNLKNVISYVIATVCSLFIHDFTVFFYTGCEGVNSGVSTIYSQFTALVVAISFAVVGIVLLYHAPWLINCAKKYIKLCNIHAYKLYLYKVHCWHNSNDVVLPQDKIEAITCCYCLLLSFINLTSLKQSTGQ